MQVRLEVRVSNAIAISMYQKMGFQQVAIVPRYYDGKEDAVTMVFEWEAAK